MQITKIDTIAVATPFVEKYVTAGTEILKKDEWAPHHILVKIYTDENIIGLGESAPPFARDWRETPWSIKSTIDHLFSEYLIGTDPFDMEKHMEMMDEIVIGHSLAKDTVVTALYDIMGKSLNIPIYKLIGGSYAEKIPTGWSIGIGTIEEAVNKAEEWVSKGMKLFKIKLQDFVGKKVDLEKFKAIRNVVGPDVSLRVDANGTYPAIKMLKKMEKYGLDLIEQPAASDDLYGMNKYVEAMDTPVMIDESILGVKDAVIAIKMKAADVIAVKDYQVGGIYRAKQLFGMLKALGVPYYLEGTIRTGIGTAATLHLMASTAMMPGCFYGVCIGPFMIKEDLIREPIQYKDGFFAVPKGTGLGVELDEEKLKMMTRTI